MPYTPNNPLVPGDPYSYDLRWMVEQLKHIDVTVLKVLQDITASVTYDAVTETINLTFTIGE